MTDAEKKAREALEILYGGKVSVQSLIQDGAIAIYQAGYAEGQRDERERILREAKAINGFQIDKMKVFNAISIESLMAIIEGKE